MRRLLGRFDWDGVNLAELYFESLEGYAEPGPLHADERDVRAEFQAKNGFDPIELFDPARPATRKDAPGCGPSSNSVPNWRGGSRTEWIGEIEASAASGPIWTWC